MQPEPSTRIYITGAGGFVGSNLVAYFSAFPAFTCIHVNLRSDEPLPVFEKGSVVIHLAGKAHDLRRVQDPEIYYTVNAGLTRKVFDAFRHSDAADFIFMSSVKAVADQVTGILTEESVPDPQTHYGRSKRQAEEYILSHMLSAGKRMFILRPCMIHGPGNKGNLSLLYRLLTLHLPWPLGAYTNVRSFLYIQNLAFIIDEIIRNTAIPSGIYQIADDAPLSTNALIQLMAAEMGYRARIWRLPENMIGRLAKLGERLHLPFDKQKLNKLTESYIVSNKKIRAAIGKPLPYSTEEGLRLTVRSFRTTKDEH
jgi:nucleoside-diphosphate-sugar epimerase